MDKIIIITIAIVIICLIIFSFYRLYSKKLLISCCGDNDFIVKTIEDYEASDNNYNTMITFFKLKENLKLNQIKVNRILDQFNSDINKIKTNIDKVLKDTIFNKDAEKKLIQICKQYNDIHYNKENEFLKHFTYNNEPIKIFSCYGYLIYAIKRYFKLLSCYKKDNTNTKFNKVFTETFKSLNEAISKIIVDTSQQKFSQKFSQTTKTDTFQLKGNLSIHINIAENIENAENDLYRSLIVHIIGENDVKKFLGDKNIEHIITIEGGNIIDKNFNVSDIKIHVIDLTDKSNLVRTFNYTKQNTINEQTDIINFKSTGGDCTVLQCEVQYTLKTKNKIHTPYIKKGTNEFINFTEFDMLNENYQNILTSVGRDNDTYYFIIDKYYRIITQLTSSRHQGFDIVNIKPCVDSSILTNTKKIVFNKIDGKNSGIYGNVYGSFDML